jgi:hypothetical protein
MAKAKRGPHKKRRRRFCIVSCWQHCDRCHTHVKAFPNRRTAFSALPILLGDQSLVCINQFGGVHLAVA